MDRDFPNGLAGIEFSLSVMKILNIAECNLPFAGIMLARSGGLKTLGLDMLVPWPLIYHTRKFNPRAFVTHDTAVESEEALRKIDLLNYQRYSALMRTNCWRLLVSLQVFWMEGDILVTQEYMGNEVIMVTIILYGLGHRLIFLTRLTNCFQH